MAATRVGSGDHLKVLGKVLVAVGALLFMRSFRLHEPGVVAFSGMITAWIGFAMILPRDSIIISLGGGFLAATMSFFVCFAVEAMLAGKITLAGVSDATFGFLLHPAPDR